MTADYLPIGARVVFLSNNVLMRREEREMLKGNQHYDGGPPAEAYSRWVRRWKRMREYMPRMDGTAMHGVIVGVRTKTSGYVTYGYDEPTVFTPVEAHRTYMVAFDLYKNPVFLLLEDVQPEAVKR